MQRYRLGKHSVDGKIHQGDTGPLNEMDIKGMFHGSHPIRVCCRLFLFMETMIFNCVGSYLFMLVNERMLFSMLWL